MTEVSEADFIERLRMGDEDAFRVLVDLYAPLMLHIARQYVKSFASAEEVVQETWLAVLQGLTRFEGRAKLKSWIIAILIKRALTRGKRDARVLPFSSLAHHELQSFEPAVDPARFGGPMAEYPRHWTSDPAPWSELPEEQLLARETRAIIDAAIAELPPAQRSVISMRDLAGQSAEDVASALELSQGNVRVLLHRGRSKVRQRLEDYFATGATAQTEIQAMPSGASTATDTNSYMRAINRTGRELSWLKNSIVKIWSKWSQTISKRRCRRASAGA